MTDNFDTWLAEKLTSLNLDEEVYSDYLKSVLEEESDNDEIKESLSDILSGVLESGVDEAVDQIINVWNKGKSSEPTCNKNGAFVKDDNIKALMEKKTQEEQTKFASKKSKAVDHELKSKLIAQYGEVSDEDEGGDSDNDAAPSDFVNVNAQKVTDKIQQEREKSKKEAEEKRQRDKLNLAKDKMKKEERKEKEKARTQKGERRAR